MVVIHTVGVTTPRVRYRSPLLRSFYFENPQSVLGGQVANARLALARLLRTVRGPPLVLSDIVTGHELRRQKLDGRSRLLPVENADADLHGAARHEEWVLRGGGLDLLRFGILERGLDIGCAVDRGDDDTAALLLMITSPLPPSLSTMYWQEISPAW